MKLIKLSLTVTGDNFFPRNITTIFEGKLLFEINFNPDDKNDSDERKEYGFGCATFYHPSIFGLEEKTWREYENDFVKSLEDYYDLLISYGANDFSMYTEIYYEGWQCNFNIFDKENMEKLSKYNLSFPVSVYKMSQKEMKSLFKSMPPNQV